MTRNRVVGWAGTDDPRPSVCIVVGGVVVGWVDYDTDQTWLLPGEVNVGYNVFPVFRRKQYASRAVELLLLYLDEGTPFHTATLSIDVRNAASLGVVARAGFVLAGDPNANEPRLQTAGHTAMTAGGWYGQIARHWNIDREDP